MGYHPRQHPRYLTQKLPAQFRPVGTFAWKRGTVLNLSVGGLMLHSQIGLELGSQLELEFSTTDKAGLKQTRKLRATVQWKKLSLYGLKFEKSAPGAR